MQKLFFRVALALIVVLGVMQLIPMQRHNPPISEDIPASPAVKGILKRACYDCHSNETVWTWYSRVAPVSWLVAWDVSEGRDALNFSTWDQYSSKEQDKKVRESGETVAEGEMPPWYYTLMHPEARLSPADHNILRAWAATSQRPERHGELYKDDD